MLSSPLDDTVKTRSQEAERGDEPEILIGSREQLFHLLAEAAEIEHTLMCSYLYAAFSLKQKSDPGLSPEEAAAVQRWRAAVMNVAVEEMGHLLMVANLTAAIGGRPHFTRPNFPVNPGYFPSGVVLRLTPFSFNTLDHFIFLERPTGVEARDGEGFQVLEHKREQAYLGLMPSSQEYVTVSHLYEAIRANLIAFAERVGPHSLFVGPEHGQIGGDLMTMEGIEVIVDLQGAGRAIDLIVEQGEGSPTDRQDSHYHRFQGIKREYTALLANNPDFAPAYPVAENPVMRRPPDPEGKVFIDAEPSARVLDLANAAYGMLLRCLVQAYSKSARSEKERMLAAAIDLMHVVGMIATALAKLPATRDHQGINAGMTFTVLRGVEPFIDGDPETKLILERLYQLARGAKRVEHVSTEIVQAAQRLAALASRFEATS
ncbi:MAG TPA: ferritin-like domain-containing protein [Bryobacteraceae bacterium]|nr:ferritin-like domain-containing protein [Bryobacteraceae bacterium]